MAKMENKKKTEEISLLMLIIEDGVEQLNRISFSFDYATKLDIPAKIRSLSLSASSKVTRELSKVDHSQKKDHVFVEND